ncbi:MAG: 3-deoxy-manno-octulosonate cytidylyltransferase, partial [Syntrophorhabdaceae bacterium]|nr:3-deoxy-manno-octulosonate cytidylyltransferase [Syntrophorhabdaceae bacterium]
MNIIGIIPARMASSRFPGKPLVPILGMPMIGHVYFRSKMAKLLKNVYVATCDREIADYIESIGGKAIITADTHERASDRCAEALIKIEKITDEKIDYVAMIQGDEPMVMPEMIDDLIRPVMDDPKIKITNLINEIKTEEEFTNPNVVKVVLDLDDYALYFSREPIPSKKKYSGKIPMWKQLGIILFERDLLIKYTQLKPTPLEIIESVDMNRLLEHGIKIKMVRTEFISSGVDVPDDVSYVEEKLKKDVLIKTYL